MPQIGDTLSDDDVRGLVSKYGRNKAAAFMGLDENAPPEQIKAIHSFSGTGQIPAEAYPAYPERDAEKPGMTAEQASNASGGIGALLGTTAPIAGAYIAGEPLLPVVGALGLAGGVGYGSKKIMDVAGTTDMLNNAAKRVQGPDGDYHEYRESDKAHPLIGGTTANFIADLGSASRPRALAADALQAIPDAASALAGASSVAPAALEGLQSLLYKVKGTPKVPFAQSGNAVLGALKNTYGTPAPVVADTGEFRAAMDNSRHILGEPVEAAQNAADATATVPKNFPSAFGKAVVTGLKNGTKVPGDFDPTFSTDPEAAKAILARASEATEGLKSGNQMAKARSLQRQFSQKAADLRNPMAAMGGAPVNSAAASVYGNAAASVDDALKSLMTDEGRQGVESANAQFSPFAKAHEFFQRANAGGDFSAAKSKALWDTLKPAERAAMDPKGYLDNLMNTGDPGLISKLAEGVGNLAKAPMNAMGMGRLANGIESLITRSPKNAFRFNAPVAPVPQGPTLQPGAGIASLLGAGVPNKYRVDQAR